MSQYTRRPFAMGNTDTPVLSQPEMRGSVKKDSSNAFAALPLPSELAIETEDPATTGGLSVVFSASRAVVDVIDQFNTTMAGYATAEEYEGCLVIKSVGVGDGAYIRVRQPVSGFADASQAFGYEAYPHPLATVSAGDLQDAPVRPRQQVNPVGTKFIATGEDRIGAAYNRALNLLATNTDSLYAWLRQPVARLVRIEVDETTHGAYLDVNVDGSLDQVDLTDLSVFDSSLAGKRLCVGGSRLSRSSSLEDISRFYAVLGADGKQLPAGDVTVRIGAVTRGSRAGVMPTFADETSAPAGALSDTTGVVVDGGSALGVNRAKHAAAVIDEVRQRTTIVCSAATFGTNGVRAGDLAVISGAAATDPFSHDGTYLVDVVVSETELILRPYEGTGHVRELNPQAGGFGSVVIYSGGEWEQNLWVSFSPSLPRFPEDGKIVLVVPVEEELGSLSLAGLLEGDVRSSADVAGWTILQLWRNMTFDGMYQGMPAARGAGFYANITHRPLRMDLKRSATMAAGTPARASTGAATLAADTLRLTAAATDRFDIVDVGKTILLNSGTFLADEPWVITRLIDNATVELAPPLHRAGYQETAGVTVAITSWTIVDSDAIDVYGLMHLVSPEYQGDTDAAAAAGGFFFSREQRDEVTTDPPVPGLFSFLHLERVRLNRAGTNITVTTAGPTAADDVLPLSFDPEDTYNIYGESYDTKTTVGQSSLTFVRILNGPDAGLYRVKGVQSSSVTVDAVTLQHLDGSAVVLTAGESPQITFYNSTIAGSVPILGGPGSGTGTWMAALSLFVDGYEQGPFTVATPLRVGWRGEGIGIFAYLNDPEFKGYDNGDGADGPLLAASIYSPAEGVDLTMTGAGTGADARRAGFGVRVRAHTNRFDFDLNNPGASGAAFHSPKGYAGYFSQTGKDPAVVMLKQEAAAAGDESAQYSKLTPSATQVVGRAGPSSASDLRGPSGRGSAMELAGSLWVYRHTFEAGTNPAWADGGVFVEDVVGAGRWLYPSVGVYDFESSPHEGTGTYLGWESPTQLGAAGQTFPPANADATPAAEILEPDYTIFNFSHSGILRVADTTALTPDLTSPYNRFVGCRVKVVEPAHALENTEFAIVGTVSPASATEVYFALHNDTTDVQAADVGTVDFLILGQRWLRGYLGIADWAPLGTALDAGSPWLYPLLTVWDPLTDQVARGGYAAYNTGVATTERSTSEVPFYPNAYGAGVGDPLDVSSMAGVEVSSGAYTNGWQSDAREPRTPIPDVGVITSNSSSKSVANLGTRGSTLTAGTPGSLLVDDYMLQHVVQNSAQGCILSFSNDFGGSLHVGPPVGSLVDVIDTLRIWMRGGEGISSIDFALQAQVTMYLHGVASKEITLLLLDDSGTQIATSGIITVTPGGDYPTDVLYTFTAADIFDKAADALLENATTGVHLAIEFDLRAISAMPEELTFLRIVLRQVSRPGRIYGHLDVLGAVRAQALRALTPVRGFQTITPLQVEMLNGEDFAKVMGNHVSDTVAWPSAEANADTQEQRGVGLLYDPVNQKHVRPSFQQDLFFKKGPHAASLVFFHPYFDPLFYRVTAANPQTWVRPGRTGFMIPLDPPHGAKLTAAHFAVSLRPAVSRKETAVGPPLFDVNFQIWATDEEFDDAHTAPDVWGDIPTWDAREGFVVRLWRFHALDFGEDMEVVHSNGAGSNGPTTGFSEIILEKVVDLSGVTEPDPEDDTYETGDEYTYRGAYNLIAELAAGTAEEQSRLAVDRRHFGYFATIECYGGCRRIDNSGATDFYAYDYLDAGSYIPYTVNLGASRSASGIAYMYPPDSDPVGSTAGPQYFLSVPPVFKFRGFRLGWTTDRLGHGGW